jgi:cyclic-di-AMP phosphodiesterase PgpH
VLVHALAAAAAAIGAGFFVQGILPNFERLFGVATSITLLEWSDASRPLLRRLAQEAPGTYSHSLVLSQLAEESASAIGSNALLARVGALYHDVGKITKPEYFVENQEARMNRHERLSPTMSLLIIVGHVKDGMEMARAYGLPRVLLPFIAEHHGTTVVRYFHHAANELAARKRDREVPDTEFRYPGPKPHSKETAILMLCDGAEGAVRALAEPTPGRIESTVHQVMMDRLTDGQFDECDITLRELHLVEQSLVKSLGAIHHGRIKYPKAAVDEVAAAAGGNGGEARSLAVRSGEVARQA